MSEIWSKVNQREQQLNLLDLLSLKMLLPAFVTGFSCYPYTPDSPTAKEQELLYIGDFVTRTLTHAHTHKHSLTHSHAHMHTHTHTQTLTHTHALRHSQTHTHTHTLTHTHTQPLCAAG